MTDQRGPMSSVDIVEDLAARIADGRYPPGSKLESYADLASLYDVSEATIATVLAELRSRGLVFGIQGKGVYVKRKS